MVKVVEELSVNDLMAIAEDNDMAYSENTAALKVAGKYIEDRIQAVIHKVKDFMIDNKQLCAFKFFVLDKKGKKALIFILDEEDRRERKFYLQILNTDPKFNGPVSGRLQGIATEDAVDQFDKRKCAMSLANVIRRDTARVRKSTNRVNDDIAAFAKIMDSVDAN